MNEMQAIEGATVMTIQNVLLGGISAVTTALVWVAKILWEQSKECARDRAELHKKVAELESARGEAVGQLHAIGKCAQTDCPLKGQNK